MTKKHAEKRGYVPIKVEIELYIHPKTRNLLFPCDQEPNTLYDRYVYLSDPEPGSDKVFAIRCKKDRRRWQRKQIAATVEALVLNGAKMYLNNKWEKLTKRKIKELREKHEWFPVIEVQF